MPFRTREARVARKLHRCDDCGTAIESGSRYVYATSAPWDDIWATGAWDHMHLCGCCAHDADAAAVNPEGPR